MISDGIDSHMSLSPFLSSSVLTGSLLISLSIGNTFWQVVASCFSLSLRSELFSAHVADSADCPCFSDDDDEAEFLLRPDDFVLLSAVSLREVLQSSMFFNSCLKLFTYTFCTFMTSASFSDLLTELPLLFSEGVGFIFPSMLLLLEQFGWTWYA